VKREFKVQGLKLFTFNCLLFTLIVLSGCVTSTDFEAIRTDVNQTRKDVFEIKKDVNDLKEKTTNVIKEEDFHAFRENQGEIHSRTLEISKELQLLTGKFDENKYSTEKALKDSSSEMTLLKAQITQTEEQIKEIKNRLNTLEGRIGEAKKKVEEPSKESQLQTSQPPKPALPKDKVSLYESAYDSFKDKQYKEAREKFETFMKEFPQDELADNAQFWIAETYYGEKDFEGAILAYEAVLKKYPKSEKAPGALLKQGFSFIEIGDKKTGKTILEKVIDLYPDYREADLAKKKIEEIEKGTGKKKK
jgi:tol-pal system protein YbgF